MPCGKRPLVKNWDRPRNIRVTKPSRYEKNEATVKTHWKNVIKELELSYKDDRFWESQSRAVRTLVGPVIFERLTKIFNLEVLDEPYVPASEQSVIVDSEQFYILPTISICQHKIPSKIKSASSFISEEGEIEEEEEEEEEETETSYESPRAGPRRSTAHFEESTDNLHTVSVEKRRSQRSISNIGLISSKIMSRTFNRSVQKSFASQFMFKKTESFLSSQTYSDDDLLVRGKTVASAMRLKSGKIYNPHFELLYCSKAESDMIKWESKYLKKTLEVSASDEYSMKAELLTKQICLSFFDWWVSVGSADYRSEIRCPADLESLFQIWFDEHASRGLVLDPKTLPCVLKSIAEFCNVPKAMCPRALKRQIQWDIRMETMPAHTTAFNSSLPQKAKHIPPQNKTAEMWKPVAIPQDLKTMNAVWGEISHLTSTKEFKKYLARHPRMPMPPCLEDREGPDQKKLFTLRSDFIIHEGSTDFSSAQELNFPVSQMTIEVKEILSKLLRD